jgi:membrane protease YdiL (CAAX protease family)
MNAVDLCLVAVLVVGLPAWAVWRSSRKASTVKTHRKRNWPIFIKILILCALAFAAWSHDGRTWAAAGFDWPLSLAGKIGLGFAGALLLITIGHQIATARKPLTQAMSEKYREGADIFPQSLSELWSWLPSVFAIGCGWEWLYRGYLLGVLAPVVGTAYAVIIATLAYGIGHGIKSFKQVAGSCLAALLFTSAYVLTHSLWWLMLIHTGMGVMAGIASVIAAAKQTDNLDTEQIWEASRL